VPTIDTTAGAALRALAKALKRRGIALALAQLHDDVLENLRAIGAEEDLGPIAAHRTIEDCLGRAPSSRWRPRVTSSDRAPSPRGGSATSRKCRRTPRPAAPCRRRWCACAEPRCRARPDIRALLAPGARRALCCIRGCRARRRDPRW